MSICRRTLRSLYPVSLRHTVLSHGWVFLAPFSYDAAKNRLSSIERIDDTPVTVHVRQSADGAFKLTVPGTDLTRAQIDALVGRVRRQLSLDWNPAEAVSVADRLSKPIARFLRGGGGRFLRGATFYEDFVKTLATVNASWSFTQKMAFGLVHEIGGGAFPLPRTVSKRGIRPLETDVKMGYRARVLLDATRYFLKTGLMEETGEADPDRMTYETLTAVKGIGAYAAAHLRVLLHDYSRIPIDSEVRPYCAARYGIDASEISAFFEPWGKFGFLGYKLGRILEGANWIGAPP